MFADEFSHSNASQEGCIQLHNYSKFSCAQMFDTHVLTARFMDRNFTPQLRIICFMVWQGFHTTKYTYLAKQQ